ncbi:restriction endonuclease subunit S [Pseudomonas sp. V88_4]|uniref:restriction endonuclease subunit S n=1 Tax=Pseudomonas sp. V88_4 TaxID=3044229 RepID=UPI00249F45BC|nr:restriction endonuclease subunit S [Pseudomonas sp. V88_4]MDI3400688.1 restriction endonuclease subunit S [Pseudomonas sp. V88_4]
MTFPAYPDYRDSGVEWLGVVPEHWGVKPLRYLGRFRKGLTITKADLTDTGIPCLNYGEVHSLYPFEVNQDIQALKCVPAEYLETEPSSCISYGDFVFADTSEDLEGVGNFTHVSGLEPLFAGYHTIIYSLDSDVSSRFLAYYLESFAFRTQLRMGVKGVKVFSVTQEILRGGIACLPTTAEQTQIALFLDHETARIDALIEDQQRLIELLKEKRQVVISKAVTKGLDPAVPMKDSGVEWLGDVPAHWVVSKFGYISSVVRGGSPRPAGDPELFNGDYSPWVTVAEITKDDEIYLDETETFLTKKGSDQCRVFSKGTLLLSNSGATLGVPKILMIDANANDGVVGFENISLDKEYSYLYLATLTEGLRDRAAGSGQPNLNTDIVKSIYVPIPPSNEVSEIVAAVKKLRAQFTFLSKEAVEGIRLLQERRSALISAAVTGKIDVRGWQSPVSAPSPELVEEAV